jgi:hypothetical protein
MRRQLARLVAIPHHDEDIRTYPQLLRRYQHYSTVPVDAKVVQRAKSTRLPELRPWGIASCLTTADRLR